MSLHLVIIGAGLAGLGAGIATKTANPDHKVTILETVKELAEVGAGLQITPNSTRLFKHWGVFDELTKTATTQKKISVYRFDGTKTLAHEPNFYDQVMERYGNPFWGMHRVDLQRALSKRAEDLGIDVRLSSRVVKVDFEKTVVILQDGTEIAADVILCADGLWSDIRGQFLGRESKAILTGDLAYRIVIKVEELHGPDKEELEAYIRNAHVQFWVGDGTHVVAYPMRNETVYNVVLLCPDDLPESVTKQDGDLEEMKKLFENWDPMLRKLLAQVPSVLKWRLMWLEPLPEWASKDGKFLMSGDCCHPMLPYLAQGANSSLEDGAVLGYLIGKVNYETRDEQLPKLGVLYQKLRKERGEMIQQETFKQRHAWHLPDGPEQEARDELMISQLGKELKPDFPSRWVCPRVQPWLYGYDAYVEAEKGFKENPF